MIVVNITRLDSPIQAQLGRALAVAITPYEQRAETLELISEYEFRGARYEWFSDKDRGYRADFILRLSSPANVVLAQLIVEADGAAWHDPKRDAIRDAEMLDHGWKTLRFTGSEIHRDAHACAASVVATLAEMERPEAEVLEQQKRDHEEAMALAESFLAKLRGNT